MAILLCFPILRKEPHILKHDIKNLQIIKNEQSKNNNNRRKKSYRYDG